MGKKDMINSEKPKDLTADTSIFKGLNATLTYILPLINKKEVKSDIQNPVISLIEKAMKTAAEISELQKSGNTKGKADNFKSVLGRYHASALCLKTMAAEILKLPPIEPSTPFDGPSKSERPKSGFEAELEKSQTTLEGAERRLESLEKQHTKNLEQQEKINNALRQVVDQLTRDIANAKTVDQVLYVLEKALVLLADLERQWKKLTMFFVALEDRVRSSLKEKVASFVNKSKKVQERGYLTKIMGQILFKSLLEANAENALINRVSRKYVWMSGKYVMPIANKVAVLMTADKNARPKLSAEVENSYKSAQIYIGHLIKSERKNFKKALEARRVEVRKIYEPLLLNVPDHVKKNIRNAISKGETAVSTIKTKEKGILEKAAENVLQTGKVKPFNWSTGGISGGLEF